MEESSDPAAPLFGKWSDESDKYIYEFKENGEGLYDANGKKMKFTYELKKNKISFLYEGKNSPTELEYEIKGDTLNIKDSFGNDTIYKRI